MVIDFVVICYSLETRQDAFKDDSRRISIIFSNYLACSNSIRLPGGFCGRATHGTVFGGQHLVAEVRGRVVDLLGKLEYCSSGVSG